MSSPSSNGRAGRRPRLLVLNQYYAPGVEATAHLLAELCEALADEFEVTVVTSTLRRLAEHPGHELLGGVDVVRVRATVFDRRRLSLRAVNYLTYLVQSLRTGLAVEQPDVVLCMTDPPMLADIGLVIARRAGAPLVVISQDVFPEIAVELNRLRHPVVIGVLRGMIRYYLRRADKIVAIGETMRRRLEEKGAPAERLTVIPNWVDTTRLTPQPRDSVWAREHGLTDRFVVMHSGNTGHAQNLDALVRAGTFLRDLDDLTIAIIGDGARRADLEGLGELLETDNVRFFPYQPRESLSASLSAADVHVVGLARGLSGYVVPSRLYGILAVGRPVIAAADADSETASVIREAGCGVVVPPGRPELLAEAIRRAYAGELDLAEMGRRAREYVVAEADRDVAISRYRVLMREIVSTS